MYDKYSMQILCSIVLFYRMSHSFIKFKSTLIKFNHKNKWKPHAITKNTIVTWSWHGILCCLGCFGLRFKGKCARFTRLLLAWVSQFQANWSMMNASLPYVNFKRLFSSDMENSCSSREKTPRWSYCLVKFTY